MNRLDFLKRATVPTVVGAAALAAKKLDPDGEPYPEDAAMIVVNAPGVTLSNLNLHSAAPRRTAIEVKSGAADGVFIHGNIITLDEA